MDIKHNPFYILDASPRDNKRRIIELADERCLLHDHDACMEAKSILISPKKRLTAEIAWFPGLSCSRIKKILSKLSRPINAIPPKNVLEAMSPLARANLLAYALLKHFDIQSQEVSEWIICLADAFNYVNSGEVQALINEERLVSGFSEELDISAIETEIQERRRYFCAAIKTALDKLPSRVLVDVVTFFVESATGGGEKQAPILIDDLVDSFEVEAQGFLDKEEANIRTLVEKLRAAVDEDRPDSTLASMVNQLIQVVKNWDTVAQPIQVSTKSRGLNHEASHRIADLVRSLAIHIFNKHDKLDFSQKLTNMLQEAFAEVAEVAERIAEDAEALREIAQQRAIIANVQEIMNDVDKGLSDAYLSSKVNQLCRLVMGLHIDPEADSSERIAWIVRDLAIHMFNKHNKLELSRKITRTLHEVFINLNDVVAQIATDLATLDEIVKSQPILDKR